MLQLAMLMIVGGGLLLCSTESCRVLTIEESFSRSGKELVDDMCCILDGNCQQLEGGLLPLF